MLTAVLVAINVGVYLFSSEHLGLLPFLLDMFLLVLLGPSVESTLGRGRFTALCLCGCLLVWVITALAHTSAPSLAQIGAWGTVVAVLCGYLPLLRRARVLTLVTVPFFVTLVEVPAAVLLGVWLTVQLCLVAVAPR